MRPSSAALLALCLIVPVRAPAEPVDSVAPPPRGRWAVDHTGTLGAAAIGTLNDVAAELDASGHGQLGVAMIRSTNGQDALAYATALSNRWGVGHADRDDGALLLVALEDRKMAIALGSGVDDDAAVAATQAIIDDLLKPAFRARRFDDGMISGARAIAQLLHDQAARPDTARAEPETPLVIPAPRHAWVMDVEDALTPDEEQRLNTVSWAMEADGEPPLAWVFYAGGRRLPAERLADATLEAHPTLGDLWLLAANVNDGTVTLRPPGGSDPRGSAGELEHARRAWTKALGTRDPAQLSEVAERTRTLTRTREFPRPAAEIAAEVVNENQGALGAGGVVGVVAGALGLRRYLRYRPRRCARCGAPRQRLDEQWDDQHLTPGERREEQLKSVDYDVWWCAICGDAVSVAYRAWLSGYSRCAACHQVTARHTTRTITHATYDHGGVVEVTERCQHCPHVRTYTRHTPRLTRSSSSSSSRSSSSSFGGGRSSGRGGSGSW